MSKSISISQALRQAAKLKSQISEARSRAAMSLNFVSGEAPPFDFLEQTDNASLLQDKLIKLKANIATANATTTITYNDVTITLTEAVAMLQELKGEIAWLKTLPVKPAMTTNSATRCWSDELDKYVEKSVQYTCVLPEAHRAEAIDLLQDKFDTINALIEEKNQNTYI